MRDRNRRNSARRRDFMDWQHSRERDYGSNEPWREERRDRYPDEPYGGERARRFRGEQQSHRAPTEGTRRWSADDRQSADYRRDFGPERFERYRRDQRTDRDWDNYMREGDRARGESGRDDPRWAGRAGFGSAADPWNAGGTFGFGPEEGVEDRGRYGYGSAYGQGDLNSDRAGRGDWSDTDWTPNRPARGSGTWAGDWADTRSNIGMGGFRGRGPRDYRRSDDRILEEVCDLFTDDPGLDASDVLVKVENGDVTLIGMVATRDQKRRAEDLAERVSGVSEVINQLRVRRGETTGSTQPTSSREKTARAGATSQQSVAADRDRS